jgi:hypothetical protein
VVAFEALGRHLRAVQAERFGLRPKLSGAYVAVLLAADQYYGQALQEPPGRVGLDVGREVAGPQYQLVWPPAIGAASQRLTVAVPCEKPSTVTRTSGGQAASNCASSALR